MKINRNYRFVLTVLDNEKINAGEIRIDSCAVTGERMKQHNPRCDWPKTAKAKVYAESCCISFGVRFGRVKQYLNTGE